VVSASQAAATILGHATQIPATAKAGSSTTTSKIIRNSIGMNFVPIPAGTFEMGASESEESHRRDETPRHTVRISTPFYLATVPVTQSHYERLTGRNPAFFHYRNGGSLDMPVESVSWYDAERFCQKLTRNPDESIYNRTYRMPTEAEWEYACRAGTTTMFSCGDSLEEKDAHYAAAVLKGQGKPCPVGQHPANAWGLQDMHGNVDEWVNDWYGGDYYHDSPGADPKGPAKGDHKIARGGDWAGTLLDCRCAARKHQHPDKPLNTLGFRVVMLTTG
jgi:formylglycine-generating enzyme required for sulfatase activity